MENQEYQEMKGRKETKQKRGFCYPHLFPLLCLAAGLVLASLCLSAGNKPGFMEEYALVRIDMSELGNNLFSSSNDTATDDKDEEDEDKDKDKRDEEEDHGFVRLGRRDVSDAVDKAKDKVGDKVDDAKDKAGDKVDDAKDKAKEKVGEIGNELVDGLAADLGIKGWYSLHVLTFCQGEYKNDTKGDKPGIEVTECSSPSTEGKFSLTETLGGDSLSAGPIDIPIPSGIQRQLAKLYGVLTGVIVFYGLSITFTALAMVSNIIVFVFPHFYPFHLIRATASLCGLAALSLMLGSAATTIGVSATAEALRDLGEFVGVKIVQGFEFVSLTWSAFGIVSVAALYWAWKFRMAREERMSDYKESIAHLEKEIDDLKKEAMDNGTGREHANLGAYLQRGRQGPR